MAGGGTMAADRAISATTGSFTSWRALPGAERRGARTGVRVGLLTRPDCCRCAAVEVAGEAAAVDRVACATTGLSTSLRASRFARKTLSRIRLETVEVRSGAAG